MVEHGKSLLLLGADLMRGGHPTYGWNLQAIGACMLDIGRVQGYLTFNKNGTEAEVPLLNVPAGLSERK